jgi:hypothetical protein
VFASVFADINQSTVLGRFDFFDFLLAKTQGDSGALIIFSL